MAEFLKALEKVAPYLGDARFHIGLGLLVGFVAIFKVSPHLGDHRYQIGLALVAGILGMLFPETRIYGVILVGGGLLIAIWFQLLANREPKVTNFATDDHLPVYVINEVRVGFADTLLGMADRHAAKDIGLAIELWEAAKRQCNIAGRLDLASSIEERIADARGEEPSLP